MAARPELAALHLCAGYGGFELALRGVARTVGHVERDAYAAATLVARMESAQLDQAPVWDDLTTFDGRPWRRRVDIVTAGFPCQPFSAAGRKRGVDDDRWLWPEIARIIRDVEPGYVFLENVLGVIKHGLTYVLSDLASLGFDAEWGLLSAAAVGAPHKRERFWLVGRHADVALADCQGQQGFGVRQHQLAESGGEDGADTASERRRQGIGPAAQERSRWLSDSQGSSDRHESCRHESYIHEFPPHPDDQDGWARYAGAQPSVRRGADGTPVWLADRLHLGGNGLVPQCAAEAWNQLTERLDR